MLRFRCMEIGQFATPGEGVRFDCISCARRCWRFSIYSLNVPDEKWTGEKAERGREKADNNGATNTVISRCYQPSSPPRARAPGYFRARKIQWRPAAFRWPSFLSSIFPDKLVMYRFRKKKLQSRVLWFAKVPRKQNRRSIPRRNIALDRNYSYTRLSRSPANIIVTRLHI